MAKRLFNLGALVSAAAVVLVAVAWSFAGSSDPRTQHLNFAHEWHLGVDASGADARAEIFNGTFGPYHGGITSVSGPHGQSPGQPQTSGVGDTLGIYFRRVPSPAGGCWWTLSVSLAYPLGVAVILPSAWVALRRRRASRRRGFTIDRSPAAG